MGSPESSVPNIAAAQAGYLHLTQSPSFLMATGFSLEEEFYLFAALATVFLVENIFRIVNVKLVTTENKQ